MAHIRQILANLSISISEFKKNPKVVVKAVKTEPIAVINNNKPAFYCVPADILETLYQKFYEFNEIQNIQDLSESVDHEGASVVHDDDSFGVNDFFQSIEDEQAIPVKQADAIVDPINNHVADPLDEEVAKQTSSNLLENAATLPVNALNGTGNKVVNNPVLNNLNSLEDLNRLHALNPLPPLPDNALNISSAKDIDANAGDKLDLSSNNNLDLNDDSNLDADSNFDDDNLVDNEIQEPLDNELELNLINDEQLKRIDPTDPLIDDDDNNPRCMAKEAILSATMREVNQELKDNNRYNEIVSGPNTYSLEHVAKTYSPYSQKKLQSKSKKEQKQKEQSHESHANAAAGKNLLASLEQGHSSSLTAKTKTKGKAKGKAVLTLANEPSAKGKKEKGKASKRAKKHK